MAKFLYRFGRRIPMPSTIAIKHEYRMHSAREALRATWAAEENLGPGAGWIEIIAHRSNRLAAARIANDPA